MRIILHLSHEASVKTYFGELGFLTVNGVYIFQAILYTIEQSFSSEPTIMLHLYNTTERAEVTGEHHRL